MIDDPLAPAARRAAAWTFRGGIAYWEGKCEEARSAFREAERADGRADEAAACARVVKEAHTAALVGDVEWAGTHIERRLETELPAHVVLNPATAEQLIELSAHTGAAIGGDVMKDAFAIRPQLADAHERIAAGDTVRLRTVIKELPLHLFQRVLLSEHLDDLDETIELYEQTVRPSYTGWGNTPYRLRALMRLGPLYEHVGDTAKAIEAYGVFGRRWALGDARCKSVAQRFTARARELAAEKVMSRN